MKKIAVIVRDKNTLVLEEDACKGDYIDLTSLSNIDFSQMEALISQGKDDIYKQKLEEVEKVLALKAQQDLSKLQADFALEKEHLNTQAEALKRESEYKHSLEIQKLTMELEKLKQGAEIQVKDIKQSLDAKYNLTLQDLQTKLKSLEDSVDAKVTQERLKIQQEYMKQLNDMNAELLKLKNEKNTVLLEKQLEMTEELRKKDNSFAEERLQLKNQYDELQNQYNLLQRQKASLNVKQTGEDLEVWCNHEVQSYMQNGFFNCLWEKDNKVVREEDEAKGSKADYIFSIFSSSEKEELLAKVCLEMKEENPDSVNRKKNSDYYRALDLNRKKKDCKYAVLVSNLELDKANDIPIYKVLEYEEMYVVRPAYLMTFLNMLVSLTTRFSSLIMEKKKENLELKSLLDIQAEFESLKLTYLDKPLANLEKNLEDVRSQNQKISQASKKIEELCDSITRSYLNEIENKLNRFDVKLEKIYKS